MRLALRILLTLGAAITVVLLVMTVRLMTLPGGASAPATTAAGEEVDAERLAAQLAAAVRIRTISSAEGPPDPGALAALHAHLEASFPDAHRAMVRERLPGGHLLFRWQGSETAAPYLLMAHQDVVPIANPDQWTQDPFGGTIDDGFVWGRGTLDDKGSLLTILAAADRLAGAGFTPRRTLYLFFGADEEIGGTGAQAAAALLAERGVRLDFVLDEGSGILRGLVPGVEGDVALVGLAEKQYLTLRLEAAGTGGHSSMPPKSTAAGRLAQAITRVERAPLPASLAGIPERMLTRLAPHMAFPLNLLSANLWLTAPVVKAGFAGAPSSNALIRTTTAVTVLRAGVKDNVLPPKAEALINFRLRPGQTPDQVIDHIRRAIDDPGVTVSALEGGDTSASAVASDDAPGYRAIAAAVGAARPDAVVAPTLVIATTDSRHFEPVADHVYRFFPFLLTPEDLSRIHGVDERVPVDGLADAVRFYAALIRTADAQAGAR